MQRDEADTGDNCNTGLGAATIKFLVHRHPSSIYLCARPVSIPSAEALLSTVRSSFPDANIRVRPLDLSSFDSVKKFATDFLQEAEYLDLLFLNAGISTTAPALTEEGYESQFGINYVGHALLTQLLMPKLLHTAGQGRDVRIMVTSSMAAHLDPPSTGLVLDQMKKADPLASPYQRYAHSKLANILFARKLSQVYPSIQSVSFNPGQVRTDLFKKATGINKWFLMIVGMPFMWLTGVTPERGAENGLWVAVSENGRNGAYYEPVGILTDQKRFLTDQKLTDDLWNWTNKELAEHGAPGWPQA
ncbi:hypothetical protein DL771_003669 [Monosporascus sp. 5C6A]|nr:hypothetical protein DL771_003669 [Monosporascus sp. 5C6A]